MSDKGYHTPKHYEQTPSISQFKTPLPYNTPKSYDSNREVFATPLLGVEKTDSDESTVSTTASSSDNNGELTIVAEFDDLMRCVKHRRCNEVEDAFLELAEQLKEMQMQWQVAVQECQRLRAALDDKTQDCSDLESKLKIARKLLDQEKRHTRRAEEEKEQLEDQLQQVRDLLLKDKRSHIADETKEKLSFLHSTRTNAYSDGGNGLKPQLSAIQEVNTTGSLLSDFSYSRSEDDLDTSTMQGTKNWKKHRPSTDFAEPAPKKRKSTDAKVVEISTTDTVRATTTLTVPKEGPITATSVIESIPTEVGCQPKSPGREDKYRPSAPPQETTHDFWHNNDDNFSSQTPNKRLHIFQMKTVVMPETCTVCEKRVGFGKSVVKCAVCRTICHVECKSRVPLPCIPVVHTPTVQKGAAVLGYIGDYTPTEPPMVPSLIVHCVNEIERRGLSEVGLYRVPGAEKEVRSLRDRFLKQRGAPCLDEVDVNVLCGTVKDFLRSLNEPLVPKVLWRDFVRAAESNRDDDRTQRLYEAIGELRQPNRDTLAFMVLHLQKIAESKACRMPIENLAKCFAPTIVGYSAEVLPDHAVLSETAQQAKVMEYLLRLPSGYWKSFIHVQPALASGKLQQTPSTDSLLRTRGAGGGGLFGSPSSKQSGRRRQKFFPTPPTQRK